MLAGLRLKGGVFSTSVCGPITSVGRFLSHTEYPLVCWTTSFNSCFRLGRLCPDFFLVFIAGALKGAFLFNLLPLFQVAGVVLAELIYKPEVIQHQWNQFDPSGLFIIIQRMEPI
jgi:hypothetical protein